MVEFFDHIEKDPFEIEQVDHHSRLGVNFSGDRHFQQIVMSVRGRIVTVAEHGTILGLIPLRPQIAMRSGKLDTFGQ